MSLLERLERVKMQERQRQEQKSQVVTLEKKLNLRETRSLY